MADPLQGWSALTERLRPDGLMFLGLYSAVSRRNLAALRSDPDYPGPGCTDQFIEGCVCSQNSQCCTAEWSDTCASLVNFCDASCPLKICIGQKNYFDYPKTNRP